jgi:hypothetical protein
MLCFEARLHTYAGPFIHAYWRSGRRGPKKGRVRLAAAAAAAAAHAYALLAWSPQGHICILTLVSARSQGLVRSPGSWTACVPITLLSLSTCCAYSGIRCISHVAVLLVYAVCGLAVHTCSHVHIKDGLA